MSTGTPDHTATQTHKLPSTDPSATSTGNAPVSSTGSHTNKTSSPHPGSQANVSSTTVGTGNTPASTNDTRTTTSTSSTQPGEQAGVHPSAVGTGTKPSTTTPADNNTKSDATTDGPMPGADEGYPEQKHAGKVGYGPNYNQGAGFTEKISGLKEEVKGKLTRNPDLVEHGRERRTGELKHKELENDDHDPFANPEEKKKPPVEDAHKSSSKGETQEKERGHKEQAATVAPEGTRKAETQRKGEAVDDVKHIG